NENKNYYLYGQPIPKTLLQSINIPKFLPLDNNKNVKNDNILLWISSNKTCSTLHFDLCEGLLFQLLHSKYVLLSPFDISLYHHMYPYDFNSIYCRQSKINNIISPDLNKFNLFNNIVFYQGII